MVLFIFIACYLVSLICNNKHFNAIQDPSLLRCMENLPGRLKSSLRSIRGNSVVMHLKLVVTSGMSPRVRVVSAKDVVLALFVLNYLDMRHHYSNYGSLGRKDNL